MPSPRLLYWGREDRQMAKRLRRAREQLTLQDIDFIEFPGLDHPACNDGEALQRQIIPAVSDWASQRIGPTR